jgi:signal transduction histidine kinase/ActR/RegA family two-component response regulator
MHGDDKQRSDLTRLQESMHSSLDGIRDLSAYYTAGKGRGSTAPAELIARAKISATTLTDSLKFAVADEKNADAELERESLQKKHLRLKMLLSLWLGLAGGFLCSVMLARGITRRTGRIRRVVARLAEGLAAGDNCTGDDALGCLARVIEEVGAANVARSRELELALEAAGVLIWELNPTTGTIRQHNGAHKPGDMFPLELLPDTVGAWISTVHLEDREGLQSELECVIKNGGTLKIEYRVVERSGNVRWMMVVARAYLLDGGTTRLLGLLGDITNRKTATEQVSRQASELLVSKSALESQTRILQSILDSMGDGVVVADNQGKFILVNPAGRKIIPVRSFGAGSPEWAAQNGLFLSDGITLYPAEELPFMRATRGESVDGAEIFLNPPGIEQSKWMSVVARPLREEGGDIRGAVLVIRDITQAKREAQALNLAKKDAENANLAKSEFLSRMSHELHTPLNAILGFTQLLEMETISEQARDNIYQILKSGYRLLELINDILDMARLESGKLSVSLEPVRLREVIKDALDLVRPMAADREVILSPESALSSDHYVQADRQRLKQVILNLLSNAIKFNVRKGAVILSCEEIDPLGLRIEIADTGPGISAADLGKIFTPFERLDADKSDAGGTGLGLALSRRLMEAMGGTLGAESSLGFGSRFYLELPRMDDPADGTHDHTAPSAIMPSTQYVATILHIEDNTPNLRLIERIMARRPSAKLISATQGYLGLDLADMHQPDWILLDLHLPDISGEEILRRLQANPGTAHIPVTILSADDTPGKIERLLLAGARDYLSKPLDVRRLVYLLDQIIASASRERSEVVREGYSELESK